MHLLRRFNLETDRFVSGFAVSHGLHRTQLNALAVMMEANRSGHALTPGELGAALSLSSPATTAMLDRLAAAGHVDRTRSSVDRRKVELAISDQAQQVGRELFLPLSRHLTAALADYSDAELEIIIRFLTDMIEGTAEVRRTTSASPDEQRHREVGQ